MSGCQGVEKKGQAMSSNLNHAAINALVAERAMGWRREVQDGTIIGYRDQNRRYRIVEGLDWAPNQFDPSRNITHAHEMRDKVLRENDWIVGTVALVSDVDKKLRVCVEVRVRGSMTALAEIERRESEPEALCLAFLQALGVSDKDIEEVCGGE